MLLPEVDYARPESVEEAVQLLGSRENTRALAGGQSLVNVMKVRVASPDFLVDLGRIRELREIGAPPYANGRGYGVQRKWANRFEGADLFLPSTLGLALTAPGYTMRDVMDWFDGQGFSAETLVPETSALEARALGGTFALPVFVIQGAEDFTGIRMVWTMRTPRVAAEAGSDLASRSMASS